MRHSFVLGFTDFELWYLLQEYNGAEQSMTQLASSPPPFFCGSPPSRAANPLTQDARFRDEKVASFQAFPFPPPSSFTSPSSSTRKGGCVRMNFGLKPAAVRVEGFDCLNRDRQNSSIPTMVEPQRELYIEGRS